MRTSASSAEPCLTDSFPSSKNERRSLIAFDDAAAQYGQHSEGCIPS